MASVGADAGTMAVVAGLGGGGGAAPIAGMADAVIANLNAPNQVVVSGAAASIRRVIERARAEGRTASELPVSGAFHSPLMAPARDALAGAIAAVEFRSPAVPVFGNADGRRIRPTQRASPPGCGAPRGARGFRRAVERCTPPASAPSSESAPGAC